MLQGIGLIEKMTTHLAIMVLNILVDFENWFSYKYIGHAAPSKVNSLMIYGSIQAGLNILLKSNVINKSPRHAMCSE